MMQTPKVRGSSAEALKVSPRPRASRQIKPALDAGSPSSLNKKSRTPKERSVAVAVAVAERGSPKGSVTEITKKLPSKVSQLESQIAELQLDLSKAMKDLISSESLKQQALHVAEESQKQVSVLNQELEDSKAKFQESFSLEEARSNDLQKISKNRELEWQSKYEALQIHHSADFAALGSAMDEIQRLKCQLEIVSRSVPSETAEVAVTDTHALEEKLMETLSVAEDMKIQLKECKDSEANALALASETLIQLETARTAVETLQLEGTKSSEAYNTLVSELDQSKGRIKSLEELVSKLKTDLSNGSIEENRIADVELETVKEQLKCMKSEVDCLRSAQETAEVEEQIRSTVQLNGASEIMEHVKSEATRRETDMEVNLEVLKSRAAELEANLMDKETELQCIIEENEVIKKKIENMSSNQKEVQLEKELKELKEVVMDLKANLMDKETEFQNILEENETLKLELKKKESDQTLMELDAAKTAERETLMKLASLREEADRSTIRENRVSEQLEAAQAANADMESELRKIKVQSDQWRKAAEVAASMLSDGNLAERNGSFEGKCSPITNHTTDSLYSEDLDNDPLKKRNSNVLKKFSLSWKKTQK